jgi:hypothetical protein
MKILFIIAAVLYVVSLGTVNFNVNAGTWFFYAAIGCAIVGLMLLSSRLFKAKH